MPIKAGAQALSLEGEIAKLAGRLDHAGEGFASLAALERAIDGLSVQLEETRQIASGLSGAANGRERQPYGGSRRKPFWQEIANLGALHENAWQRVQATLTDIQQSLDHLTKAVRARAGLRQFDARFRVHGSFRANPDLAFPAWPGRLAGGTRDPAGGG